VPIEHAALSARLFAIGRINHAIAQSLHRSPVFPDLFHKHGAEAVLSCGPGIIKSIEHPPGAGRVPGSEEPSHGDERGHLGPVAMHDRSPDCGLYLIWGQGFELDTGHLEGRGIGCLIGPREVRCEGPGALQELFITIEGREHGIAFRNHAGLCLCELGQHFGADGGHVIRIIG